MGWELGGGLGHVARLLSIARGLRELGHRPVFAVRNPQAAAALFDGDEFPVLQIPPLRLPSATEPGHEFRAGSYADILRIHGFADPKALRADLDAWDQIFVTMQPKLIVFEHAPRLSLAALGKIDSIHVGTGFTCPPVHSDVFPAIGGDSTSAAHQADLTQIIRDVQQRRAALVPQRLTDVLACRNAFVAVWPQLDPYRAIREVPAIGPLEPMPGPTGTKTRDREFFAYLSGEAPGIELVIAALARSGLSGRVYLRDASAEQQHCLRAAGIAPETHPIPLDAVFERVRLVVHHGGAGVAGRCLAAGCCQIILPRHQEQKLTGDCVESLQTGRAFFGNVRLSAIVEAARTLMDSSHRQRAFQLAETLLQQRSRPAIDAVLEACIASL